MTSHEAHNVNRPQWTCVVDGSRWPCAEARQALTEAYRADPAMLTHHMTALMVWAETELGVVNPATLFKRFVGWTVDTSEPCRVCGKSSHVVITGVPPRFQLCREIHEGLPIVRRHPADNE